MQSLMGSLVLLQDPVWHHRQLMPELVINLDSVDATSINTKIFVHNIRGSCLRHKLSKLHCKDLKQHDHLC